MGAVFSDKTEDTAEFELNRMGGLENAHHLGSRLKNGAYNLKEVIAHVWAGGAATTDTGITPTNTLDSTDIIVANAVDSVLITGVAGVYNAGDIDLTSVGNGANGEIIQILIYHKVVTE